MMTYYIKLGRIRGISIELNRELGSRPFFQKNTFHHETILDIPYVQIIYTSGLWVPKKRSKALIKKIPIRSASNVNEETGQITKCSKRAHNN